MFVNPYVKKMTDVIDYIEESITATDKLTLENLSKQFFYSEYHFSRIFKVMVGTSLNQYVLGRKLCIACKLLRSGSDSITDISYKLGFRYPEVFSRCFKKHFHISPLAYRRQLVEIATMPKAKIVDRDICNYEGKLVIKASFIHLNDINLYGLYVDADENNNNFGSILNTSCAQFLQTTERSDKLLHNPFYSTVQCQGDESGKYTVFLGKKARDNECEFSLDKQRIPCGWYARFSYYGALLDIRSTFIDDLYRWLIVKEIELCANGIGMINDFDLQDNNNIHIYIPILQPR